MGASAPGFPEAVGASAPERILVRAPNWVGDVVMATPALRALARAHPGAELTVEARGYLRELLEPLPHVTHFRVDSGKGLANLRRRVRRTRRGRFDWAVILPDSPRSALGPCLARVPRRVGYTRGPLRRPLLTQALPQPTEDARRAPISMIERYLVITRALGCPDAGAGMEVPVTDAARAVVARRLEALGLGDEPPFCLAIPGASFGASKLWPAASFARACEGIGSEEGLPTLLAPGPGEEGVARAVAEGCAGAHVLDEPVLSLGELAALVARARLVVTNDTGPRQIAVALGVPAVVLMGPTDPRYTQHHLARQAVLRAEVDCAPCGEKICPTDHRCMTRIEPERVVAEAARLLADTQP